jgi:hypothetical protein
MKETNNVKNFETGQFISRISYCKVVDVYMGGDTIEVENEYGKRWFVGKEILQSEVVYAHDVHDTEVKVTRTEMMAIFESVGDAVFTVKYKKKVKPQEIKDAVTSINKGKILSNDEISKVINKVFEGEDRTLVGYRLGTAPDGRVRVIDLQVKLDTTKEYDNRIRLVDPRTMYELTTKNIKFVLKK